MSRLRWRTGTPAVRARVERWLEGGDPAAETLRENPRRRLVRLRGAASPDLLVKHFRTATGRHPRRERWKARLGASPARREARALVGLAAAGAPVPTLLGEAQLPEGDALLVLEWIEGRPFVEALRAPAAERHAALGALGAALARVHRAGWVHGDAHVGNALLAQGNAVLLDLQEARRSRRPGARRRDLGDLDYSLSWHASLADRLRFRAAALGRARPFDATARAALRRVGAAARASGRRHGASRTRRSLRPGRLYARLALPEGRGLRWRAFPEAAAASALAAHADALARADGRVLKDEARTRLTAVRAGGRPVVVKSLRPRGPLALLADAVRGSPARRAWRAGHGLLARGVGAARPLAFVERRGLGLPLGSAVVLEDLRAEAEGALEASRAEPEAVLDALARLLIVLHGRAIEHSDLKVTNLFVGPPGRRAPARLVDLEGVRFRRRLAPRARRKALAELNASLPDAVPADARRRAFERYAAARPFPEGGRRALERVVAASLARAHRWTGAGCVAAGGDDGAARRSGAAGSPTQESAASRRPPRSPTQESGS